MNTFIKTKGITVETRASSVDIARSALLTIVSHDEIQEYVKDEYELNFCGYLFSLAFNLESKLYLTMLAGIGIAAGVIIKEGTKDLYEMVKKCVTLLCQRSNETVVNTNKSGVLLIFNQVESIHAKESPSKSSLSFRIFTQNNTINLTALFDRLRTLENLFAIIHEYVHLIEFIRFEYTSDDDFSILGHLEDRNKNSLFFVVGGNEMTVSENINDQSSLLFELAIKLHAKKIQGGIMG